MNSKPIIFALANPNPEILPNIAKNTRPDAIVATGRSDFPNQVNNVLCFPFIFRGALDVGAQQITEEMKLACVHAIAELAHAEITDEVATTYSGQSLVFGSEYLIPKPFDPRLIISIAPKVAKAAMESGVATRPIVDFAAYQEKLQDFVYRTGFGMRNIFHAAKQTKLKKVIFSEGEEERILRAAQIVVEEKIAFPILIGRPDFINRLITKSNLNLRLGIDFELVDPSSDQRYRECWQAYHQWSAKDGVTPGIAKAAMRRNHSVIGATLLRLGYADALIAGGVGAYHQHLDIISRIIGKKPQVNNLAAMSYLMLPNRAIFISDTHVNDNPSAEDLVEISLMAAEEVRRFGITPKLALLSHSNFGSYNIASSQKMRKANELLLKVCSEKGIELEFDGEMHGDTALSQEIRDDTYPNSQLKGEANLLIMPNLDAANISYNLLKMTGSEGVAIGPILLGAALPVHVLTSSTNVRKMVNMTAIAVVDTENR